MSNGNEVELGAMQEVDVIVNEVVAADVRAISLVKHGAIRVPFRVIKSDTGLQAQLIEGETMTSIEQPTNQPTADVQPVSTEVTKQEIVAPVTEVPVTEVAAIQVPALTADSRFELSTKAFDMYAASGTLEDKVKAGTYLMATEVAMGTLKEYFDRILWADVPAADARAMLLGAVESFHEFLAKLIADLPDTAFYVRMDMMEENMFKGAPAADAQPVIEPAAVVSSTDKADTIYSNQSEIVNILNQLRALKTEQEVALAAFTEFTKMLAATKTEATKQEDAVDVPVINQASDVVKEPVGVKKADKAPDIWAGSALDNLIR